MHRIFYDKIFITGVSTNKSLTIEEMLGLIDFDEEAFRDEHNITHSLDPAEFRTVYFDFDTSLPGVVAEVEELKDLDNSDMSFRFKQVKVTDKLLLTLFDDGLASLEFGGVDIVSFHWDEVMEDVAARLIDGDVGIRELFVNIEERAAVE